MEDFAERSQSEVLSAHPRWQETIANGNIPVATICRANVLHARAGSQMSLREQWAELHGLFTCRRGLDDLHEEIETHLAMEIKDAQGTGSDPDDVQKRFGNRIAISESTYHACTYHRDPRIVRMGCALSTP